MWSPTGLIPWFSKTEGNTYATLLHHPFLFKGKPTHAQEVAISISGTVAGEIYAKSSQVKTYQVPITNSYPSHYIICHLPLVFLSPTSPLPFYLPSFLFVSFRLPLVCLCVGLFVTMAQDNTKLCDFSNTNNNDFLSTRLLLLLMLNLVKLILLL